MPNGEPSPEEPADDVTVISTTLCADRRYTSLIVDVLEVVSAALVAAGVVMVRLTTVVPPAVSCTTPAATAAPSTAATAMPANGRSSFMMAPFEFMPPMLPGHPARQPGRGWEFHVRLPPGSQEIHRQRPYGGAMSTAVPARVLV